MGRRVIIIGVDPGKLTGISRWISPTALKKTIGIQEWTIAEVSSVNVLPTIRALLNVGTLEALAVERFVQGTGRRPMSHQPDAQHVMGELSGLAQELKCHYALQLPGPAKKIASDRTLKEIGAYWAHGEGHGNDASRQVIRYLANNHADVFADLIGI